MSATTTASSSPNDDNLEQQFNSALREATRGQAPLNMILAGKSGAGKSTLLNVIFGRELAETGVGAPVTTKIERHTWPDFPIAIYDAPGIELGRSPEQVTQAYLTVIRENIHSDQRQIHFVLYCISATNGRYEPFELDLIRALAKEVPVFLVLTRCPTRDDETALELARKLTDEQLPIQAGQVFLTLSKPRQVAFGLDTLVTQMYQALPEAVSRTLASRQHVSLELKITEAGKIVDWATGLAATIALVPIPVLDAIPLSALQFTMLGKITNVMDLEVDIKAVVTAIAGIAGVSMVARQVARQLFKMIPGVGTAINSAMAASITRTMGQAYTAACSNILRRQITGETIVTQDITAEIITELRRLWGK